MVKNLPAKAGAARDVALLPGSGRSPGGGHGSPLQHSCLENPRGQGSLAGCSPWGHRSQPWPSTQAWADKFGCEFQSEGGRGGWSSAPALSPRICRRIVLVLDSVFCNVSQSSHPVLLSYCSKPGGRGETLLCVLGESFTCPLRVIR